MCTNKHYITNKYTGQRILVNCGHCNACLQEKANRNSNLIRRHAGMGQSCLFVTLTYDRISCPYVLHEDLFNRHQGDIIPVYREFKITHSPTRKNKRVYGQTKIGEIEYNGYGLNSDMIHKFRPVWNLKYRSHGGVCYYKDVQNFFKRLRINLKRKYNYVDKIDYFSCSEYGSTTKRPHFHILLFFNRKDGVETQIRDSIVASWPYASKRRTLRGVEVPRGDCSSYVASYVNCHNSISKFLIGNFPPKRTFSKFFGKDRNISRLGSLLEMFERGDFGINYKTSSFSRTSSLTLCPTRYINFYFPKIKGLCRLSDPEVCEFITNPSRARFFAKKLDYREDFEQNDFADNFRKLDLGFVRFSSEFGDCDRNLYAFYYTHVWSRYDSYRNYFKYVMAEKYDIPIREIFSNSGELYFGSISGDGVDFNRVKVDELNPNNYPSNVAFTHKLNEYFRLRDKQKRTSGAIYSAQGFNI